MATHFFSLGFADPRLKGQEVFLLNLVGLGKDLSPSVLACAFDSQHREPCNFECWVVIVLSPREKEIGFGATLCDCATAVSDVQSVEKVGQMVFKGQSYTAFTAVLDRE